MNDEPYDDLVVALQDALVPPGVPVLPGLDIAARFAVPPGAVEAGGTWFDAVVLDDGRVGLVVGEVPGTGLSSAAAMGQVSAVLRTALLQHGEVGVALDTAEVHAARHPDSRGTMVVVALVDPADGLVSYATAGHPAPVVSESDGPSVQLPRTGGVPLGLGTDARVAATHRLAPDEMVVVGCSSLTRAARTAGRGLAAQLDEVADTDDQDATTAALVAPALHQGRPDIVSVIVAKRVADPRPGLSSELTVDAGAVNRARHDLDQWLSSIGAPRMDAMAIVHSAAELVVNAIEHADASTGRSHTATMTAHLTPAGDVLVEVVDHGAWRTPSEELSRGRGLAMAAGLVDDLDVVSGDDGTRARIVQRLCRPVRIQRDPGPVTRSLVPSVVVEHLSPGAVSLRGAFGHDDVDRVAAELLLASRGGTRGLDVDLAGLTDLSAGGVRLLTDLVDHGRRSAERTVVLRAPDGSAAHHELEQAGIPHRAA